MRSLVQLLAAQVLFTLAIALALNAKGEASWQWLLVPYALFSLGTGWKLGSSPSLRSQFAYHRGDPSLGALVAGVSLGAAWLVSSYFLGPASPRTAWLFLISLSARGVTHTSGLLALVGLVALEEWVWRGWVRVQCEQLAGERLGWLFAAALYSLAHVPTVFTLASPEAGPNPLLVLAALALGLVLGGLQKLTGRLVPGLFAHVIFSYFGVTWLLVPS